jgi:hypothetical protein
MTADEKNDDQTKSFTVLTAGVVISHYKIISKIGAGGMGEVYFVRKIRLSRRTKLSFC